MRRMIFVAAVVALTGSPAFADCNSESPGGPCGTSGGGGNGGGSINPGAALGADASVLQGLDHASGAHKLDNFIKQQKECGKVMVADAADGKRLGTKLSRIDKHDYVALCQFGLNVSIPSFERQIERISSRPDICPPDDPVVSATMQVMRKTQANNMLAVAEVCAKADRGHGRGKPK